MISLTFCARFTMLSCIQLFCSERAFSNTQAAMLGMWKPSTPPQPCHSQTALVRITPQSQTAKSHSLVSALISLCSSPFFLKHFPLWVFSNHPGDSLPGSFAGSFFSIQPLTLGVLQSLDLGLLFSTQALSLTGLTHPMALNST